MLVRRILEKLGIRLPASNAIDESDTAIRGGRGNGLFAPAPAAAAYRLLRATNCRNETKPCTRRCGMATHRSWSRCSWQIQYSTNTHYWRKPPAPLLVLRWSDTAVSSLEAGRRLGADFGARRRDDLVAEMAKSQPDDIKEKLSELWLSAPYSCST